MNTTRQGDQLEARIASILRYEIDNDLFWAKKECCTLQQKARYFSASRGDDIVFDISIQIAPPGTRERSLLVLIECKNYSHPVGVEELEQFWSKLQQVEGNKGIFATATPLTRQALAFAKSKGFALLRSFPDTEYKWELRRSPFAAARKSDADRSVQLEQWMVDEAPRFAVLDLCAAGPSKLTVSMSELIEDMAQTSGMSKKAYRAVQNKQSAGGVPFLGQDEIADLAYSVLERSGKFSEIATNLDAIASLLEKERGLSVTLKNPSELDGNGRVLGRIVFDPDRIEIARSSDVARQRFTLAHELGHFLLSHKKFLRREYCAEIDLGLSRGAETGIPDIDRMEWQANHFATCLLMPYGQFLQEFSAACAREGVSNRGFGPLYVDEQECNVRTYISISDSLLRAFSVSRAAVTRRMVDLDLMTDARKQSTSVWSLAQMRWMQ